MSTNLILRVFDPAFSVTDEEEAAILKAAQSLMFPETEQEWLETTRQEEKQMIGNMASALESLCQAACERAGVNPASKTFLLRTETGVTR